MAQTVDDKKIIFSLVNCTHTIPQTQKTVLKNIYISFFYGAKIGIIGLNGAGKSTLMKIIAGIIQPSQGEVVWSPGYSVGYLEQDPKLDETKTVKEKCKAYSICPSVFQLDWYCCIYDYFLHLKFLCAF